MCRATDPSLIHFNPRLATHAQDQTARVNIINAIKAEQINDIPHQQQRGGKTGIEPHQKEEHQQHQQIHDRGDSPRAIFHGQPVQFGRQAQN